MKTQRNFLLIMAFMITALGAFALDANNPIPRWASDKGYWVVETTIAQPKLSTVYFYNKQGVLIYKEKVEGVKLKVRKASVKMHLKQVLESSVTAWEQQHVNRENEDLVMNALKRN